MYASFRSWIRWYTGLTLYDFRVLDRDGTSEKEVRDLFHEWLEDVDPVPVLITKAIDDAMEEGFDVLIAE